MSVPSLCRTSCCDSCVLPGCSQMSNIVENILVLVYIHVCPLVVECPHCVVYVYSYRSRPGEHEENDLWYCDAHWCAELHNVIQRRSAVADVEHIVNGRPTQRRRHSLSAAVPEPLTSSIIAHWKQFIRSVHALNDRFSVNMNMFYCRIKAVGVLQKNYICSPSCTIDG